MTLATIQTYIYNRTKTNATSFPNASMVVFINTANERVLSQIRGYKDTFYPTAWSSSDLSTGTAVPVFDSMFHELIPLWVTHQFTSDNKLRSAVAEEIRSKEQALMTFYGNRHLLPVTVTIATPGVFTLKDHSYYNYQEVVLSTTGALPSGLSVATIYYVLPIDTDTFQVTTSLTSTTAVNTTGTQSGTHYISGLDNPQLTMSRIHYR